MTTLAIPPVLELVRHFDWGHSEFWVYETPAGQHVMVVYNETAEGFVAHHSNSTGSWAGPRIIGGHGKGRGLVLEELEQLLEGGRL